MATSKGVLGAFQEYLKKDFGIDREALQECINYAKEEQYKGKTLLDYGDVVIVDLSLHVCTGETMVRLLFVVDSQKTTQGIMLNDNDLIEGGDPRITILKLFEKCVDIQCDTLFLAAMGTHALRFPYSIAITEIINSYAYSIKQGIEPRNVLLSVRNEDMKRAFVKQNELITYTHRLLRLYKR